MERIFPMSPINGNTPYFTLSAYRIFAYNLHKNWNEKTGSGSVAVRLPHADQAEGASFAEMPVFQHPVLFLICSCCRTAAS